MQARHRDAHSQRWKQIITEHPFMCATALIIGISTSALDKQSDSRHWAGRGGATEATFGPINESARVIKTNFTSFFVVKNGGLILLAEQTKRSLLWSGKYLKPLAEFNQQQHFGWSELGGKKKKQKAD